MSPDLLRVKPGERISARHHNSLVRLAEAITIKRGPLKGRHDADGFTPHIDVRATVSVDHAFRISLSAGNGTEQLVTFTPGYVSGIMPTIEDVALDDVDERGDPPALTVKEDAWQKQGRVERALILFRYELREDFAVKKVVPVAEAVPPPQAPFEWHKLIAILTRRDGDVKVSQQCFFSQGFDVSEVRDNGLFHAWPHAEP